MKSVLFITALTPNNKGAGVSYTNRLLIELSKTCLIDLVYFHYASDEPYSVPNSNVRVILKESITKSDKIKTLYLQPGVFPLFAARYKKSVCEYLQKQVSAIKYDFVYFDFSQTFCYARYINHPNKILMAHDVIGQKYSRMKPYLKPWAKFSERRLLKSGDVVFTFSEKDCDLINKWYGIKAESTTFFLKPNVLNAQPDIENDYFVFFGSWGRVENSEALEWFIDNVYNRLPLTIQFKVIGGGKMPERIIDKMEQLPNVEFLGYVDNPYPIIANARAEIAPLHKGAGVKVKCIEALGCGTPIIGTEVAFEGIGDQYGNAIFEANSPEEYAAVIESFDYPIERKKDLKKFFTENYNNKQILKYING